jgi:hypothetical protein
MKLLAPSAARRVSRLAAVFLAAWAGPAMAAGAGGASAGFATPDQAVDALIAAVRSDKPAAIERVLGPGSGKLVDSGDHVADRSDRAKFAAAFDQHHDIERRGGDVAVLHIGSDEWPFPVALHAHTGTWHFDARAGAQEILDRRIGRNETSAMTACLAFVDAERDYASADRTGSLAPQYAQKFVSSPGKTDGLYWPAAAGVAQSPLGPLMAAAQAEGYGGRHEPYHGYYYKILTGQGPHAPDGARDYVVKGRMIGGFALIAWPAKWGDSGVMTFMVNQDGIVYEKSLGRDTARRAPEISRYDPDASWKAAPMPAETAGQAR